MLLEETTRNKTLAIIRKSFVHRSLPFLFLRVFHLFIVLYYSVLCFIVFRLDRRSGRAGVRRGEDGKITRSCLRNVKRHARLEVKMKGK